LLLRSSGVEYDLISANDAPPLLSGSTPPSNLFLVLLPIAVGKDIFDIPCDGAFHFPPRYIFSSFILEPLKLDDPNNKT